MDKTEFEWWCLNNFKRDYPYFPEGKIIKSERPDFIVEGDKTIGLELCTLYREDGGYEYSIQRQADRKKEFIEIADEHYKKLALNYEIIVSFKERTQINKRDFKALLKFLFEKIEAVINTNEGEEIDLMGYYLEPYNNVFEGILFRVGPPSEINSRINVYSTESISDNKYFYKLIENKQQKEYKGDFDELWLIMPIDFFNMSSQQDVPFNYKIPLNESKFNRIFLHEIQYRRPNLIYQQEA